MLRSSGRGSRSLARSGRGRASRVTLTRVEPVKPVGNGGGEAAPAAPEKPALSLDLTKAVPTRDVDKVRTAMRDATDKGDDASDKLLEDVESAMIGMLAPDSRARRAPAQAPVLLSSGVPRRRTHWRRSETTMRQSLEHESTFLKTEAGRHAQSLRDQAQDLQRIGRHDQAFALFRQAVGCFSPADEAAANTCAACHATLDPLSYPFRNYHGISAAQFQARYIPLRLEIFFKDAAPRITQTPERGAIFGKPVADLREWARVAADSDAFAIATTTDYWKLLIGHAPRPQENAEFVATWRRFKTDHQYRVQRLLHDIVKTEAYGAP